MWQPLAPALCLAKGAGWNREVFQQPQAFSSRELALDNLGKAGFLVGWEGELVLSSLAEDVDQIFFSNLSESEEFFNGFCILSSFLVIKKTPQE